MVLRLEFSKPLHFSVTRREVDGIDTLHAALVGIEREPRVCVIRGEPRPNTDLTHTRAEFMAMSAAAGWHDAAPINPPGDGTVMRDLMGDQDAYAAIFGDLRPVIWKLARKDYRQ